jgi:hypothetical protein
LQQAFNVVDAGGTAPSLTAENLLQEGVGRGIKAAEEPARGQMVRYVGQQIERLEILAEARRLLGGPLRQRLRQRYVPIREDLAGEAQQPHNAHRALARVYGQVIGVEQ